MSIASILEPVRPCGQITFRTELWICTAAGEPVQNITSQFDEGSVSINWLGAVKATMTATLREPVTIRPLLDWIMPRMIITFMHQDLREIVIDEPLGVFTIHFPDQVLTESLTTNLLEGFDALWVLSQLTNRIMRWAEADRDYGSTMRGLLYGESLIPLQIPDAGRSPREPINILPAENLLDVVNMLADKAGMWDLAATRQGLVTTSRRTVLGQNDPKRQLVTTDVVGEITRSPDREAFFNRVYLSSNSPDAYEGLRSGYVWDFTDEEDPYSVVNGPIVSRPIFDARDETVEELDERARLMLQSGAGVADRYTIEHLPDPRFDVREDWSIDIRKDSGQSDVLGTYRVEAMEFGLTQETCAQVTTVSRLVNANRFARG